MRYKWVENETNGNAVNLRHKTLKFEIMKQLNPSISWFSTYSFAYESRKSHSFHIVFRLNCEFYSIKINLIVATSNFLCICKKCQKLGERIETLGAFNQYI